MNDNYKILIADDEQIECTALELLLKNTFSGIQILPSVSNGVDFINSVRSFHPDIVIVDIIMPGMNGLDALDMIRTQYPDIKVILHSSYSEFSYAKRAIALNAFDYIVKPIQKPVFIELMKRVFHTLDQEREKKSSQENIQQLAGEVTQLVENDMMSSILLGTISEHTSRLFLRSLSQEYNGGFLVTVRKCGNLDGLWTQQQADELLHTLNQVCLCLGKLYGHELILYLIPNLGVGEGNYQEWARTLFSMSKEPLLYGISTWKFTMEELPAARKESESILIGKQEPGSYFFEFAEPVHVTNPFSQEKEQLTALFFDGKTEECNGIISRLIHQYADSHLPLEPLKVYSAYFFISLYEQANKRFPFPCYTDHQFQADFRSFISCTEYEDLNRALDTSMEHLHRQILAPTGRLSEHVNKGILCILKMYNQNISLEDIARLVGISPFYLSRLLKQELDQTFVEILTEVRITAALKLLRNTSKTIREISEEVGYLNTNYFYKVFKKQTGMTVGEIRRYLRP